MKMLMINPMKDELMATGAEEYCEQFEGVDSTVVDEGPDRIGCRVDYVFAAPGIIRKVMEAEKAGYDAIAQFCTGDAELITSRVATRTLVLGVMEVAVHIAAMLGSKFSLIGPDVPVLVSTFNEIVGRYKMESRLASTRGVDLGRPLEEVIELSHRTPPDPSVKGYIEKLVAEAIRAIEDDGASVIIICCTSFVWLVTEMQDELRRRGYDVPVIEPVALTIEIARSLVKCGLTHSKVTYPSSSTCTTI